MADKNHINDAPVVDAESISRASNPISKATLIMIAAAILFIIIASVIIFKVFNSPTGNTQLDSPDATARLNI